MGLLSYYLYRLVFADKEQLIHSILFMKAQLSNQFWVFFLVSLMSIFNWIFEIFKWQKLVQNIENITYKQALIQTLSSHSLSLISPFKTGDYVLKTFFYDPKYRTKVLIINGLGNLCQMLVTIIFGIIGILILMFFFDYITAFLSVNILLTLGLVAVILYFLIYYFKKSRKFQNWKAKLLFISKKSMLEVLIFSIIKYLIFSHQFYFLMDLLGVKLPYIQTISVIFSVYLVSSILPIFTLFDFVIKGSIAVFLFSKYGVNETIVLASTTVMWFLNFIFPAIIGIFMMILLPKDRMFFKSQLE